MVAVAAGCPSVPRWCDVILLSVPRVHVFPQLGCGEGWGGGVTHWVLCSQCLSFPTAQPDPPFPTALRLRVLGGCAGAWQQCVVPEVHGAGDAWQQCMVPEVHGAGDAWQQCMVPEVHSAGDAWQQCVVPEVHSAGDAWQQCMVPEVHGARDAWQQCWLCQRCILQVMLHGAQCRWCTEAMQGGSSA